MKRVAIYCRVSTAQQNIDSQIHELKRFCLQRNLHIFNEYIDKTSGAKSDRPSLNILMADARKRKFDLVLVFRFDRMARSASHLLNVLNEFKSLGVDFISYQENIDTTTALGQAMFTIIGAMAQLERDIIRERVMAGLQAAKHRGKKLGRPSKRNDSLILNYYNKGYSFRKIAKSLNISLSSVQRCIEHQKNTHKSV